MQKETDQKLGAFALSYLYEQKFNTSTLCEVLVDRFGQYSNPQFRTPKRRQENETTTSKKRSQIFALGLVAIRILLPSPHIAPSWRPAGGIRLGLESV